MKDSHGLLIVLLLFPYILQGTTTVGDVEKNLMCTCGCTMALHTCECGRAAEMRSEIQGKINQGMTEDQIVSSYVARFGEEILSAPTKKGFNLFAWIMPFLILLIVGALLYKKLKRWNHSSIKYRDTGPIVVEETYTKKLEEELAKIEEGEAL
ncbi:MAG: cytochrome c-type biogenesis protein CcmH [Calditrichia bacterium]